MNLSIRPFIHPSIYLSISLYCSCVSISESLYLSPSLALCLSACMPAWLSVCLWFLFRFLFSNRRLERMCRVDPIPTFPRMTNKDTIAVEGESGCLPGRNHRYVCLLIIGLVGRN